MKFKYGVCIAKEHIGVLYNNVSFRNPVQKGELVSVTDSDKKEHVLRVVEIVHYDKGHDEGSFLHCERKS